MLEKIGDREVRPARSARQMPHFPPNQHQQHIELIDTRSVRQADSEHLDSVIIHKRFGEVNRKLVRLSLPVFSDDERRALVQVVTIGGVGNARGGAFLFEKKQDEWIVSKYLQLWIT